RREALRLKVDVPTARLCGAALDQLEQAVARADVPAAVGLDDDGRAPAADAGVDDAEKRGPRRKPFGIGRQQVGRCLGIAGRRIGEEVDRRYARRDAMQHRLHLTRIGTVQAEIREQHDHLLARLRPAPRNDQPEFLRRPRGAQRARRAVKNSSGDAGRYSRSFGLSASLASPPCGEWKAYRVTAAIARNSNFKIMGPVRSRSGTSEWLPFLNTYRTMCLAPQGSFRRLLEEMCAHRRPEADGMRASGWSGSCLVIA